MENQALTVTVKQNGQDIFLQTVPDTKLLPKVMAAIMTAPQGAEYLITVTVNNEPIVFTKGGFNVRELVMVLNELRLPIQRAKKGANAGA
jgi:hypothetical protein